MEFAPAAERDLEELLAIDRRCSPVFASRHAYVRLLQPPGFLAVAREQGQVLGFCALSQVLDEATLLNLAVLPERRRSGVGGGLLAFCIEELRVRGVARILLEVRAGNAAALAMYSAMGFCRDGVRRAYYPALDGAAPEPGMDGTGREDAVLMSLPLGDNDASA